MANKYNLGNMAKVICRMAEYAIRDQESLIYAMTPDYGHPPDETTAEAIQDAKNCISDFRRIRNVIKQGG